MSQDGGKRIRQNTLRSQSLLYDSSSPSCLLRSKLRNRLSSDIADSIIFINKIRISKEYATEPVFNNVIEV